MGRMCRYSLRTGIKVGFARVLGGTCATLGDLMKDISDVRRALGTIREALAETTAPRPPRFGGPVTRVSRSTLAGLDEVLGQGRLADRRPTDVFAGLHGDVTRGHGVDALAWYHPFHVSPDEWGIYVPETSVHYVAERWFNPQMNRPRRIALALDTLLAHEIIHHVCEYAVAQYELLLKAACWRVSRKRLRDAGLDWFDDEEALANAHAVRCLTQTESAATVRRVHQALLDSPRGYRDFPNALDDDGFDDHLLEVLRHNVGVPALDLETGFLEPAFEALAPYPDVDEALERCPIYMIEDAGRFGLPPLTPRLITCIPRIDETSRFQSMLRKLDHRRQEEWTRVKAELAVAVPAYPRFKKLKGRLSGLFGVRLGDGFRAHLRPADDGVWLAVEVGSHTAMGHD